MIRYQNHTLEETPTENFPTLVTITKGPKKYGLVGRKYITEEKARIAVEVAKAESLIDRGGKQARKELQELGLAEES